MQKYARTTQITLTVCAAILLMATALRSQQTPPVGPVWEYSSVTDTNEITPTAQICYVSTSGCKYEKVSAPEHHAVQEAMMMAAARLGEKGWELTTTNGADPRNTFTYMYFKRLRSAINRDNSASR